jgi:lipopolysaccharide/colanic/teichoic acid biosynthesis glycosyltransferase
VSAGVITATEREFPFITQKRPGKGGVPITIAKLRTMPHGTEETMSNGHYDERATKFGKVLRVTRVDETPQLWNVLTGDMSMVGLRPLVKVHHDQFMDELPPEQQKKVERAYDIARPGWFDPYGVDMYVHGVPDTAEARAESIIRYTFYEASAQKDMQIMLGAFGIVKNIVGDTGIDVPGA